MRGLVYTFPTAVEADVMTQAYFVEREKFIGEEYLPFEEKTTSRVQWDDRDNARGMTAVHKMGTDPQTDAREGSRVKSYTPIPFKETDVIAEDELLQARELGTLNNTVNIDGLVAQTIRDREDKNFIRAEWARWEALRGLLDINEKGVRVRETFPVQVYDPLVEWDNHATATPLRDMAAASQLLIGTGSSAEGAVAITRSSTFTHLLENTNDADLRSLRSEAGGSANYDLEAVNKLLTKRKQPIFRLYDEGWNDGDAEVAEWNFFVHEGDIHIIGKRPKNQKVGAVAMTPTLHRIKNGQPAPGMFSIIEVNGQGAAGMMQFDLAQVGLHKNPKLEITGGFYGGPFLRYARSVIRMRAVHP